MGPLLFRVNQICIAGDGLLEMVQLCKQGVSGKQAIASKYGRDIRCFEAAGRTWGGGNKLRKPGSRAVDAASLQEMRMRCSLLCTICADTSIQPHLPQVLLTNGKIFRRKPAIPHLKGNLIMWTQKSAWVSQATLRRYVSLLGSRLQHVAPGRDYLLLLDCAPCHLHDSIKNQAKMCRIRLLYIAAGLTRLLQPADIALFGQLKQKLAELYLAKKADNATGKIHPLEWLDVLGSTLQTVLPAVRWSHAFQKVGALNGQTDVPSSVFADLGWSAHLQFQTGPQLSWKLVQFSQREES